MLESSANWKTIHNMIIKIMRLNKEEERMRQKAAMQIQTLIEVERDLGIIW